jgi:hypothetical protein
MVLSERNIGLIFQWDGEPRNFAPFGWRNFQRVRTLEAVFCFVKKKIPDMGFFYKFTPISCDGQWIIYESGGLNGNGVVSILKGYRASPSYCLLFPDLFTRPLCN